MKLIIAGSRSLNISVETIKNAIEIFGLTDIKQIIAGECPSGADLAAKRLAKLAGYDYLGFPADWHKYGKAAGVLRNKEMSLAGDFLLLLWDGSSKGSHNMRENMKNMKKPIFEIIFKSAYIENPLF